MLALTKSAPQVRSIIAAALAKTFETGCERFVAALPNADMVSLRHSEQLGAVVPGNETPRGR